MMEPLDILQHFKTNIPTLTQGIIIDKILATNMVGGTADINYLVKISLTDGQYAGAYHALTITTQAVPPNAGFLDKLYVPFKAIAGGRDVHIIRRGSPERLGWGNTGPLSDQELANCTKLIQSYLNLLC